MSNYKKYTIEEIVEVGLTYLAPLENHYRYETLVHAFAGHITLNNNYYAVYSSAEMYRMFYEATRNVIVNNDFTAPGTRLALIDLIVFFYEKMNEEL